VDGASVLPVTHPVPLIMLGACAACMDDMTDAGCTIVSEL
jgi:hypothetical protein